MAPAAGPGLSPQPFLPTTPMAMKMGISWITYTMVCVEREGQASMSRPLAPAQTRLGMPGGLVPLCRVQTPGEETRALGRPDCRPPSREALGTAHAFTSGEVRNHERGRGRW